MGGFEGGDEGGFWDEDAIGELVIKQKKQKPRETVYEETSDGGFRITVEDNISFIPYPCASFTIEGCDSVSLESNSIYKAYKALESFSADSEISDFFEEYKVVVTKNVTLENNSRDAENAAAFMRLAKEVCNLMISADELLKIGQSISDEVALSLNDFYDTNA